MTLLPQPTVDGVLTGMMAALATIAPVTGVALAGTHYLRVLDRYVAGTITGVNAEKINDKLLMVNGAAGRTPAVLVDYLGDRPIRTTVGYKSARTESTYIAICVADPKRVNREKAVGTVPGIFEVAADVQRLLASRRFGFNMAPLRYTGIAVIAETPGAYAWGVKFLSQRHVDYTKKAAYDTLLTINDHGLTDGAIIDRYNNEFGFTVRF
jgi:hypothetical protein